MFKIFRLTTFFKLVGYGAGNNGCKGFTTFDGNDFMTFDGMCFIPKEV